MNSQITKYTRDVFIGDERDFYVRKSTHIKNAQIEFHFHDYYEIEIVTKGKGVMLLNGETFQLQEGDVFFILPNDFHSFMFLEETEIYNISFCEEVLLGSQNTKKIIKKHRTSAALSKEDLENVVKLCSVIIDLNDANIKSKHYLLKAILELFPKLYRAEDSVTYFNKAVAFIENRFKDRLTVADVARHCSVNEDYLNVNFKREIGITATEYIRKKRLEYSDILLKSTTLSISQIAFNSGFQSIQTFNRIYKTAFGFAPSKSR